MKLFVSFRKSFLKEALIILLFISCSESNNLDSNPLSEGVNKQPEYVQAVKPKDYGVYHNKVLSIFIDETNQNPSTFKSKRNLNDFRGLIQSIRKTVGENDSTLINEQDYRMTIKNMDEVFNSFTNETEKLDYYTITERLFELKTSKRIGSLFSDFLHGNYSYDEVVYKINLFEKEYDLSSIEKEQMIKFKVTLKASKKLWDGILKDNSISKLACNPQSQQYLADGFGTLFGGLGAVGYSYAIYILQDNGKHCI